MKIVITIIIFASVLFFLLIFYWRILFKRFISVFKVKADSKAYKIILSIISIAAGFFTVNIFSGIGIMLLHIIAFSLITELVNSAVKLVKADSRLWQKVYKTLVIPVIAASVFFVYGFYNIRQVNQTYYAVKTQKNISRSYRILLIADVHFGTNIDEERLEKICGEMSETNPDIVVLCGDIVDEKTEHDEVNYAFKALSSIKSTYGTYFVYGNHDRSLYNGNKNFSSEEVRQSIENNGITILQDETVEINGDITLAGREDLSLERISSYEILSNANKDNYVIMLDHQPEDYAENSSNGADMQLSGHTHAGQVFPAGYFIKWLRLADLYYGIEQENGMTGIVTSGLVGWGYPIRTQEHSEYVVIDIQKQ